MPPIARFMGATWGPSGADRTQVGRMLAPWTLLSGALPAHQNTQNTRSEIYRGTQSSNTLLFCHGLLFNTGSFYPYISGLLHWHEQSYKIGTKFEEYICVNEFPPQQQQQQQQQYSTHIPLDALYIMAWNGNVLRITGPMREESTGHRWIPLTKDQGPVLLTLLRHVARILANGSAAFFESCDAIGWNSCDVSQKR